MERVARQARAEVEFAQGPAGARRKRRGPLLKAAWVGLLAMGFGIGAVLGQLNAPAVEPGVVVVTQPPPDVAEPEVVQRLARLVRDRRWVEARLQGIDCVRNNPSISQCHKLLGTTYVRLGETDRAVDEYRKFLEQAPNHPDAEKVRAIVDNLDSAR